jgi:hypothetical protein
MLTTMFISPINEYQDAGGMQISKENQNILKGSDDGV